MFDSLKESWKRAEEQTKIRRAQKDAEEREKARAEYEKQLRTLNIYGRVSTDAGYLTAALDLDDIYNFFQHKMENNPLKEENALLKQQINDQRQQIKEQSAVIEKLLQQLQQQR